MPSGGVCRRLRASGLCPTPSLRWPRSLSCIKRGGLLWRTVDGRGPSRGLARRCSYKGNGAAPRSEIPLLIRAAPAYSTSNPYFDTVLLHFSPESGEGVLAFIERLTAV